MSRPLVSVYDTESATVTGTVTLPAVFTAPIRGDVVNYVHNLMSKNSRQAYGNFARAGMQVRIYII
jgi:large subunit ribosomal protein L4e